MEKTGYIEVRVLGSLGNIELKPDSYDIKEIVNIIEQVEKLLFPNEKGRPIITYKIEEGSVRNIFYTSMQAIIGVTALFVQINSHQNIDFLESGTAKAIETFQDVAVKKNYSFEIKTSLPENNLLRINPTTHFYRTEEHWSEAEFYFYGKVTNAGGKEKPNIHLLTEEYGSIIIQTTIPFLSNRKENILYKTFGIRAKGKQNSATGEIDKNSLSFLELVDYDAIYDEEYLKTRRNKAKKWLTNINPDDFLNNLRGYNV